MEYKKANDVDVNTLERLNEYTFKIVMILINKIKNMAITNGYESVYNNLPNNYKKFSYDEFLSLFSLEEKKIIQYINRYNGNPDDNFINMLISISRLNDDRIGSSNSIPYGNDEFHKKDADYRIYINTPNGINRYEFLKLFIEKCVNQNIPYEMKGEEHIGDEKDRTIIYCFNEYFDEIIKILEEIKSENPKLVSDIGSPIATGLNYSYYAISTSRQKATYNLWFNRVTSHAINYLCANLIKFDIDYFSKLSSEEKSQIESVADISNYSFDLEGGFSLMSNNIINDYIIKNKEKIMQEEVCQKLIESLKVMCSLANFRDLEHINYPISLDSEFYKKFKLVDKTVTEEKKDDVIERELYLYHTEQLFNSALEEYFSSDLTIQEKVMQYISRVTLVEKAFRKYATTTNGFVGTERYKKIQEFIKNFPRFTLYVYDETKGNFINQQNEKRYYAEIANQLDTLVPPTSSKKM